MKDLSKIYRDDTPKFNHDCDACIFMGRFYAVYEIQYDCYFCPKEGSVVVRMSSDPSDYHSATLSTAIRLIGFHDEIVEAHNAMRVCIGRAAHEGVITAQMALDALKSLGTM